MNNTIDIYSTPEYRKVEAVVQLMVDGRLTSYRVATETNISKMSLATLTKGTSKIKNITYQTALALIDWYDENHEKYGSTIDSLVAHCSWFFSFFLEGASPLGRKSDFA